MAEKPKCDPVAELREILHASQDNIRPAENHLAAAKIQTEPLPIIAVRGFSRYKSEGPLMKATFAIILSCFAISSNIQAQVVLNPDDTWSYHFETLGYIGLTSFGIPEGNASFMFSSFPPGSAVKCEMFEGLPSGAPLASKVITGASGAAYVAALYAWDNKEGSIRCTMLTGSVTIASIRFHVQRGLGVGYDVWESTVTPSPIPPTLKIIGGSNAVELSWWTNGAAGYSLEWTNNIPGTSWVLVAQSPTVITGRNLVTLNTTGESRQYFRLRK